MVSCKPAAWSTTIEHGHTNMCVCIFGSWGSLGNSSASTSSMPKAASTTGVGLTKPSLSKLENEKAEPEKFQDFHL